VVVEACTSVEPAILQHLGIIAHDIDRLVQLRIIGGLLIAESRSASVSESESESAESILGFFTNRRSGGLILCHHIESQIEHRIPGLICGPGDPFCVGHPALSDRPVP